MKLKVDDSVLSVFTFIFFSYTDRELRTEAYIWCSADKIFKYTCFFERKNLIINVFIPNNSASKNKSTSAEAPVNSETG